ncbi:MAG: ATP-binding protein [Bacteroidales bacterium]|nr:ATP-binding protein [Bacteroidales bacterium]
MKGSFGQFRDRIANTVLFRRIKKFRSSIYGRVVFIITGSLLILFIVFNIIFRSIYVDFFNKSIRDSGNNISSIVESSLYTSMLENDKETLQRTLDIISTMSGIDQANMYDENENLAYSSIVPGDEHQGNPNCKSCHTNLNELFPEKVKSYHIVGDTINCGVLTPEYNGRHLLIRTPILNESSCFTAECHAHDKTDEVLGSLVIKLPLDDLDTAMDQSSGNFLLLATLITAILVSILVVFTRRRIQRPLDALIKASESVSRGDTNIRLDIKPELLDDMRKVSEAFNDMLDKMDAATSELQNWSHQLEYKVQKKSEELSEAQNELIHVERIASLGKLSSSVAHEINNPLSGILIYTKLVHKQINVETFDHPKKEPILKHLKYIENETKRCGDIVKGLLDFSRKDQEDFVEKDIHGLLKSTFDLITHSVKIAGITLKQEMNASDDIAYCSPNQIKQAFFAILVNAIEAISDQGEIAVKTSNPDKNRILISISDNGSGIAPQDMSHIFEPFFSTKRETSGTGLGLAIVHGIIENHKGTINVESEPGKGTSLLINLPLKG